MKTDVTPAKRPSSHPAKWSTAAAWLVAAAAMCLILLFRLELSFDLSAFFPKKSDLATEVLLDQLSSGPGSRMLVIGVNGGESLERIETGRLLRQELTNNPAFASVFNGEWELESVDVPEPVYGAYPLMADIDYSAESMREALLERLANLAFGGGSVLRTLVARDPYFVTLNLLQRLAPGGGSGSAWLAADGSAVLTALTRSPGTDLQAQASAIEAIRSTFATVKSSPELELEITGVGAFSLELQSIIQKEARLLGILAGSAILLVLLVVYRSIRLAILATLPLGLGYLAGLAAVALVFDTVHGITLAFGFTLLGVTVDYPLHLFSHARREGGSSAMQSIWPTLRLGAASTATAYLAMVFSGSQGLSQLGVFTAVGVVVAVLATRSLLPGLLGDPGAMQHAPDKPGRFVPGFAPAAIAVIACGTALFFLSGGGLWNDALDTLSPVPKPRIEADQRLRSATGSVDLRYQVMIQSDDLEELLRQSGDMDQLLQSAVDQGMLQGWSSITTLLPQAELQEARLAAVPSTGEVSQNLRTALAETAFLESAFRPFKQVLSDLPDKFPLTPGSFDGTPLESWRDAHLVNLSGQWIALDSLTGPRPSELEPLVSGQGESVQWVDLQKASGQLMRDFRHDAVWAIAAAALVIVLLLLAQRIGARRLIWVAATVGGALALSVCAIVLAHGYLTIVHLVALLLVLGLGLDYALFFSRDESYAGRKATIESVLACAASTTLAFGILSASSIPLLRFIGLTVAAGSIASLVLAWLGSRGRDSQTA